MLDSGGIDSSRERPQSRRLGLVDAVEWIAVARGQGLDLDDDPSATGVGDEIDLSGSHSDVACLYPVTVRAHDRCSEPLAERTDP